ncbi:MAG TPA: MmcQ/YjbR family DNA-binding protein [Candidatus Saccharimonadales bacterium]|nr:MmcQ/YjbR family DNA-binding protein [Candidatus Saccharimonadales bacterium]
MLEHKQIEQWITALGEVILDYPFGEGVAVYKVDSTKGKMFALIEEGSRPVRLSLKCDPKLAELLRDKYETVLPGYHLNKKHWNTIICSGQLPETELKDLIRHSYELAKA